MHLSSVCIAHCMLLIQTEVQKLIHTEVGRKCKTQQEYY